MSAFDYSADRPPQPRRLGPKLIGSYSEREHAENAARYLAEHSRRRDSVRWEVRQLGERRAWAVLEWRSGPGDGEET